MSERDIANQAKAKLKSSVIANIVRTFPSSSGEMKNNTDVKASFNKGQLVRLGISGPKHLYVQNYGFEGVKSNGINQRLKATNVVNNAIEESGIVDFLSEALSEFRAEQIVALIRG